MSWASRRVTTRIEEQAYCLMGLFGIHMHLLYGEAENAFLRLQVEILSTTGDDPIFAWEDLAHQNSRGLLAPNPQCFRKAGGVELGASQVRREHSMTNKGLQLRTPMSPARNFIEISHWNTKSWKHQKWVLFEKTERIYFDYVDPAFIRSAGNRRSFIVPLNCSIKSLSGFSRPSIGLELIKQRGSTDLYSRGQSLKLLNCSIDRLEEWPVETIYIPQSSQSLRQNTKELGLVFIDARSLHLNGYELRSCFYVSALNIHLKTTKRVVSGGNVNSGSPYHTEWSLVHPEDDTPENIHLILSKPGAMDFRLTINVLPDLVGIDASVAPFRSHLVIHPENQEIGQSFSLKELHGFWVRKSHAPITRDRISLNLDMGSSVNISLKKDRSSEYSIYSVKLEIDQLQDARETLSTVGFVPPDDATIPTQRVLPQGPALNTRLG